MSVPSLSPRFIHAVTNCSCSFFLIQQQTTNNNHQQHSSTIHHHIHYNPSPHHSPFTTTIHHPPQELTDARIQLKIERNKRIVMEEERDVARRVGNMAHTEWKKEYLNTILSQGSEQYLKTIFGALSQKKNVLHNKYFKAITWGSHESNWRIHLQELLRQEQQRVKEKNECLKMGHEEIANSKVERKIGTVL